MGEISEKKRQAVSENVKLARLANEKHGLYRYLSLAPDKWPAPMATMYQNRFLQLTKHDHIDDEKDAGIIAQVCRLEVILARVYEWLMQHDIVDQNGAPQPVLSILGVYESALKRAYSEAGLTPVSRRNLRLQPGGVSWAEVLSADDTEGGDDDATDTAP